MFMFLRVTSPLALEPCVATGAAGAHAASRNTAEITTPRIVPHIFKPNPPMLRYFRRNDRPPRERARLFPFEDRPPYRSIAYADTPVPPGIACESDSRLGVCADRAD